MDHNGTGNPYLVICDGVSQLLDKPGQHLGVVNIAQEPDECMLFSERFELCNDPPKYPERGASELMCICTA